MKSLAERFAKYIVELRYEHLPCTVVHEAKRRLIDSLGCAYGAYHSEPGRIARDVVKRVKIDKGASVLGTSQKTSPELATFANGTLVRYLDYNDTYLSKEPAHPSDNISSAIAISEAEYLSGKELITGIVLGYEIQCRLCDAASLRKRGWDHVTYGSFSTAALASKLYSLDIKRTENAIAIAGVSNNALRQTRVGEISMWKACAFANAARNGVFSAALAKAGMTGPSEIFEGKMGFWNQVSGKFDLNMESFGGINGCEFMIMRTDIKSYPAEYHAQSAIEAMLELRKEKEISELLKKGAMEDIDKIVIKTFEAAKTIIANDEEKWHPKTRETADHSMPYCVAVALMDGIVSLEQFTDERISDPLLNKIIQKITVIEDKELTELYPARIPNIIEIVLKDKRCWTSRIDIPKGHSMRPMTDAEIETKFWTLTEGVVPEEIGKKIVSSVWELDKIGDVTKLVFNHVVE